jgi:hypothetical protein
MFLCCKCQLQTKDEDLAYTIKEGSLCKGCVEDMKNKQEKKAAETLTNTLSMDELDWNTSFKNVEPVRDADKVHTAGDTVFVQCPRCAGQRAHIKNVSLGTLGCWSCHHEWNHPNINSLSHDGHTSWSGMTEGKIEPIYLEAKKIHVKAFCGCAECVQWRDDLEKEEKKKKSLSWLSNGFISFPMNNEWNNLFSMEPIDTKPESDKELDRICKEFEDMMASSNKRNISPSETIITAPGMKLEPIIPLIPAIAKRGDIVFIETTKEYVSLEEWEYLYEQAEECNKKTGVNIVYLQPGMKVMRIEQDVPKEQRHCTCKGHNWIYDGKIRHDWYCKDCNIIKTVFEVQEQLKKLNEKVLKQMEKMENKGESAFNERNGND